jgi:hypothetical protein
VGSHSGREGWWPEWLVSVDWCHRLHEIAPFFVGRGLPLSLFGLFPCNSFGQFAYFFAEFQPLSSMHHFLRRTKLLLEANFLYIHQIDCGCPSFGCYYCSSGPRLLSNSHSLMVFYAEGRSRALRLTYPVWKEQYQWPYYFGKWTRNCHLSSFIGVVNYWRSSEFECVEPGRWKYLNLCCLISFIYWWFFVIFQQDSPNLCQFHKLERTKRLSRFHSRSNCLGYLYRLFLQSDI